MRHHALIPLEIDIRRASWRMMSSAHETVGDQEAFLNHRRLAFERDDFTCCGCNFRSPPNRGGESWMEVHHRNHSHNDHSLDNLATICPLCHQVFHIGFAGMRNSGILIWMPEIDQATVNNVARTIFIAIHADNEMSGSAKALYASMEARALYLEEVIAQGSSDPALFGQAFLECKNADINRELLGSLRLLPTYNAFLDPIVHWSTHAYAGRPIESWEALMREQDISQTEEIV